MDSGTNLTLTSISSPPDSPTDFSNWVFIFLIYLFKIIPGRFLVGAYPKRRSHLTELLKTNVTTFVNLVQEREIVRMEPHQRYPEKIQKILQDPKIGIEKEFSAFQFFTCESMGLEY